MIKKVSKSQIVRDKMELEKKIRVLDSAVHLDALDKMNKQLKAVRMEYQIKNRNSHINASQVILTA